MYLTTTLLTLLPLLITPALTAGVKNNTQEFRLKTSLKPGQPSSKSHFDNLWLSTYHTGAGENDVVFEPTESKTTSKGYLNATSVGGGKGVTYHTLEFDLGTSFPWFMDMELNYNFYAAWELAAINVYPASPAGGFWINDDGLQWTSAANKGPTYKYNEFGGWLVCDWFHGLPQLFFRVSSYSPKDYPTISSCAEVYLMPEYV